MLCLFRTIDTHDMSRVRVYFQNCRESKINVFVHTNGKSNVRHTNVHMDPPHKMQIKGSVTQSSRWLWVKWR